MVAQNTSDDIDRIFHALADATRRDIVVRVVEREQSVSSLAVNYSMSFAAVQKHVTVLESAALVTKVRRGREQIVNANLDAVRRVANLLNRYEELWRHRADRISTLLLDEELVKEHLLAEELSAEGPSESSPIKENEQGEET
jgi:DNA-binding transcriptional ArsR family regulator